MKFQLKFVFKNLGDIIYVKNYIDEKQYIEMIKLKTATLIVVISFGVLVENMNNNNLTHHIK